MYSGRSKLNFRKKTKFLFAVLLQVVICVLAVNVCHAAAVLTGDTSRPESSTFASGEKVIITFSATGLASTKPESLIVSVTNADSKHVANWTAPVVANTAGNWQASWTAPSSKLGFFRVWAHLSDGTTFAGLGSRPAGYISYCVVPNPALRTTPSEANARFGMQGGFNANVNILPYLGIRWVLEGYFWSYNEPQSSGQFATGVAAANAKGQKLPAVDTSTQTVTYNGVPWQVYTVACLMNGGVRNGAPTWAETSDGAIATASLPAWSSYCAAVAKDYCNLHPNQTQHIYQLAWEPDDAMTQPEVLAIYQSAYAAMHAVDAKAVVIGPTSYSIYPGQLTWDKGITGLSNYIDGIGIHPYFTSLPVQWGVEWPEQIPDWGGGVPGTLAQNARVLAADFPGKPLYGTEQGFNSYNGQTTTAQWQQNELAEAESLLRENLIMLGEHFQFNMTFYIADYPGNNDYGYYYNLLSGEPFATSKISPKPIAPAYAAQSFLLEGSQSDGVVPGLGANEWGYVFQNGSTYTVALWTTLTNQMVTLPVGVSSVSVYDWMGNMTTVKAVNNSVTLAIGPEPIYVVGGTSAVLGQ
jgi:hypothetical protein